MSVWLDSCITWRSLFQAMIVSIVILVNIGLGFNVWYQFKKLSRKQ